MTTILYVATRKGLLTLKQDKKNRWGVTDTDFLGDPVSMLLPDPRDGTLYAALNLGHFGVKLRRRRAGQDWEECTTPAFPVAAQGEPASSVNMLWCLEGADPKVKGSLWAGTLPGGLFHSADGGDTWTLNESLWNRPERREWAGGGYDQPGIHSICIDPRNPAHIALGVSVGGIWTSRDGGDTWQCNAKGMRAAYMPPERAYDPEVQDPHRLVQSPSHPETYWVQHHNGIFRSTDGAATWQEITSAQPSVFGFAVAVHPRDPNTAWFVPAVKDECRVPVDGRLVVTRTRDGGQRFDVLRAGLPQEQAYDLVYRHGLDIDSGGNRLAIGSTTGGLWLSEDQGDHWQEIAGRLPPIYAVRFGE